MMHKWKALPKSFLGVALLLTLLAAVTLAVNGQQWPPMLVWGVVYINEEPAEDGTLVVATDKYGHEVDRALTYTNPETGQKGSYGLTIEQGEANPVRLFVLGIEARESPISWEPGSCHLDLHITKAHLVTAITYPTEHETYSTEQEFTVSAAVENVGLETATSVTATIAVSPTHSALLVWPAGPEQTLGTIGAGSRKTVTWTLQCAAPGSTKITVAPYGWDAKAGMPILKDNLISATVTITQEEKAHLEVTGVRSDLAADTASTGQTFHITATVHNGGVAVAESVTATLEVVTGSAEIVTGPAQGSEDLAYCQSQEFTWEVQCTGAGSVRFLVTPWGRDENTDEAAEVETGTITITQKLRAHLEVTLSTDLADNTASTGQAFHITATVHNAGVAVAEGVTATLEVVTGSAEVVSGPAQGSENLAYCQIQEFTWEVKCTGRGVVEFLVTPWGTDENTGEAAEVETGTITITQKGARLEVEITSAPENAAVGTTFEVFATVSNTGEADATRVTLTLNVTGGASLLGEAERSIGDLDAGATSDPVTWTLRCNSPEPAVVGVRPAGIEVNTSSAIAEDDLIPDEATVLQRFVIRLLLIFKNYTP